MRETIVRAHIDAENRHDVEATIATFHAPRYEVNGEPVDGADAVRGLLGELIGAFPDMRAHPSAIRHAEGAVLVEGRITATHAGDFAGVPATGRPVDYAIVAIFEFEDDRLLCEKVHFDAASILTQIGALPGAAAPAGA